MFGSMRGLYTTLPPSALTERPSTYRHTSMNARRTPMDDGVLVRVLKALADPTRFRMVQEIAAAGELTCGQVAGHFDVSQPTISHHLKILSDAGIIQTRP